MLIFHSPTPTYSVPAFNIGSTPTFRKVASHIGLIVPQNQSGFGVYAVFYPLIFPELSDSVWHYQKMTNF